MSKLLITLPALNEEDSIREIVERCLEASVKIISDTEINDVEITVVSDGSTDKTVEIASEFSDKINLIVFKKNRGYGAAIKEAFNKSNAEYVSFLDADGTCDPNFFIPLFKAMQENHADIILGCRLNSNSKMPTTRVIGNKIFGVLLTTLSDKSIRDTASGMRIIRRDCLSKLYPLPNGLEFTPAMSAKSLLSGNINLIDIDMPYNERSGISKLHVIKDGFRFLKVIIKACLLYRPSRLFNIALLISAFLSSLFLVKPFYDLFVFRYLADWLIYRSIVGMMFGVLAVIFGAASYLSQIFVDLTLPAPIIKDSMIRKILKVIYGSYFWIWSVILIVIAGLSVFPAALDLFATGHTSRHWIRFVVMTLCLLTSAILIITSVIRYVSDLIREKLLYTKYQ